MKLLFIASSFLLLQGCVGIGGWAIGDHSSPVQDPTISKSKGIFSITAKPNSQVFGSDFLLSHWGPPDDRERIDGGGEIWEYRLGNLRWHGSLYTICSYAFHDSLWT